MSDPFESSVLERIASEAGVSPRTVQRILSGGNKQTWKSSSLRAEQIRAIADRHCYMPNSAAKAVSTGRFGVVSLLLSTQQSRSNLPSRMLDGISDEAAQRDLILQIAKLPDSEMKDPRFIPKMLRQRCSDGMLVDYTDHIPQGMHDLFAKYRVPSVWINSNQSFDCVRPNELSAGYDVTKRLMLIGHRRIAYVDLSHTEAEIDHSAHYSIHGRRNGYERAMFEAGIAPQVLMRSVTYANRGQVLYDWLASGDRPTAVVAYSTSMCGPLYVAAMRHGLAVPKDLSLVGFGDGKHVDTGIVIATCVIPQYEVGRQAIMMLTQKMQNPSVSLAPRELAFNLVEGQSIAPPVTHRQV